MESRPVRNKKKPQRFMDNASLISAVYLFPCLWDKSFAKYHDKLETQIAWQKIASSFVSESPNNCRKQWQALLRARRNNYRERMKKEMSGAPAHSFKPYIYDEMMSFVTVTPINDHTEGNLQNLSRSQLEQIDSDSNNEDGIDDEEISDEDGDKSTEENTMNMSMLHEMQLHQLQSKQEYQRKIISFNINTPPSIEQSKPEAAPQQQNSVSSEMNDDCEKENVSPAKKKAKKSRKPLKPTVVNSDDEDLNKEEELHGFGGDEHEVHKMKAAAVQVQNAKKELMKRKWDLAVAKAKNQQPNQIKPSQLNRTSTTCTFNEQLQQDLYSLLLKNNAPEDSDSLFCLSLVDRMKSLPGKTKRKVQLQILQTLSTAEDEEEEAASNAVPLKQEEAAVPTDTNSGIMLSKDMQEEISKTLDVDDLGSVVSHFGVTLKGGDIKTLKPNQLLNDQIINFYLGLIQDRDSRCCCLSSFFYVKLSSDGIAGVEKWAKNVDWSKVEMVVVPIHLPGHWTITVIDLATKNLIYYDSLIPQFPANSLCETLINYIVHKRKDLTDQDWTCSVAEKPRQRNSTDCGVFICYFAECMTRGVVPKCNPDIDMYRRRMVYEIIHLRLL